LLGHDPLGEAATLIWPDLDSDAGVERHVPELVLVAEHGLHAEHVLLSSGGAEPLGDLGERLAHVFDGGIANAGGEAPRGSAACLLEVTTAVGRAKAVGSGLNELGIALGARASGEGADAMGRQIHLFGSHK
jgi:hypothetical protein